jgi:dihydrofolate synthase/folylpolyglutamate synthase
MLPVTAGPSPLIAFDDLLDLERSRAFHEGREALGLSSMESLLEALRAAGHLLRPPGLCVHVAGSEGKTSVTELIAAGLRAAGRSTGTYTSPHLRDARERLRIDGVFPPDAALRRAVEAVRTAWQGLEPGPSWFEAMTATAAALFSDGGADAAVWETGLGGRLDATRCLPAELCVITSISLEHTAILGDTLAAVAREKAGILRPGRPAVVGAGVPEEAREQLLAEAERLGCPVHAVSSVTRDAEPAALNQAIARCAVEALVEHGLLADLPEERLSAALEACTVEGRADRRGDVFFDGAHTVAAIEALVRRRAGGAAGPVVFGATSGRDALAMARALRPGAAPLILTRSPGVRGVDPGPLAEALADDGPEQTHGSTQIGQVLIGADA